MKAEVVNVTSVDPSDFDVSVGDVIEVLGVVHDRIALQAVYRDDEGHVATLPAWMIRMLPNVALARSSEDAA